MGSLITSSAIVTKALSSNLDGVPAQESGHCSYCGHHIEKGELHTKFAAGPSFMDDLSLAARGSGVVCAPCTSVISAEGLRATQRGVFSESDGFKPFNKWKDVRSSLINPPDGRFVMLYATGKNQHMAWRAPVNHSKEMFYVRVGLRDLKIRRQKLLDAVAVCERVAKAIGIKVNPESKTLPNPFSWISPDAAKLQHPSFGSLSYAINKQYAKDYEHLQQDQQHKQDLKFLLSLTLGELWGLIFVLSPNAGEKSAN